MCEIAKGLPLMLSDQGRETYTTHAALYTKIVTNPGRPSWLLSRFDGLQNVKYADLLPGMDDGRLAFAAVHGSKHCNGHVYKGQISYAYEDGGMKSGVITTVGTLEETKVVPEGLCTYLAIVAGRKLLIIFPQTEKDLNTFSAGLSMDQTWDPVYGHAEWTPCAVLLEEGDVA